MDVLLRRSAPSYICRRCSRQVGKSLRRSYSSTSVQADIYDVVCVGGGPAGLSLLTALRKQNTARCALNNHV